MADFSVIKKQDGTEYPRKIKGRPTCTFQYYGNPNIIPLWWMWMIIKIMHLLRTRRMFHCHYHGCITHVSIIRDLLGICVEYPSIVKCYTRYTTLFIIIHHLSFHQTTNNVRGINFFVVVFAREVNIMYTVDLAVSCRTAQITVSRINLCPICSLIRWMF